MDNSEYLKGVKASDEIWHKNKNISYERIVKKEFYEYRKIKASEIIAEELIGINDKLDKLINEGKVINVDTHEI